MTKVNKYFVFVIAILISSMASLTVSAQQDPMYTKYMFNSLAFNPAYAGTHEYLSATAIIRDQWLTWGKGTNSIEGGAPITYLASVHSPVGDRVGLGGYVSQDRIGANVFSEIELFYAYRIPLGNNMQLSAGIQGGVTHQNMDFTGLNIRHPEDGNFIEGNQFSWLPNAGAGLYLYADRFYIGASVPRLFESRLNKEDIVLGEGNADPARAYRHMYVATGAAFPMGGNENFVFKPSVLVKGVGWLGDFATSSDDVAVVRTPTEFDIDLSMLFYNTLWLGASFRSTTDFIFQNRSSHDSADLWGAFYLPNGLRLGLAYDYSLTRLQQYGSGSVELMLGYDMNFKVDKIVTPRYF